MGKNPANSLTGRHPDPSQMIVRTTLSISYNEQNCIIVTVKDVVLVC